jgi:hypothetical protein
MNAENHDRLKNLLKDALPPMADESEPARDLWPTMLHRLNARPKARISAWAWFDIALFAGLAGAAVVFPTAIPVLLYYL